MDSEDEGDSDRDSLTSFAESDGGPSPPPGFHAVEKTPLLEIRLCLLNHLLSVVMLAY